MQVKAWKSGTLGEPKFPDKFKIIQKAVLQKTDISNNNNKYYAIELHKAGSKFRVFTHYGRTDDLNTNPNAGAKECRYCSSESEAATVYDSIYEQKTGARKGYQQVHLASSKIGSQQAQGQSCGEIDDKTLTKMKKKGTKKRKAAPSIDKSIADLVKYLYSEAVNTLTITVDASITANGIETPLGVLTIGQVDSGQAILDKIAKAVSKKRRNKEELSVLSGQFYTAIPHRLGRSRQAVEDAVITTPSSVLEKNETLQLMRDMLNVNSESNVLMSSEIIQKYEALHCDLSYPSKTEFNRIKKYVAETGRRSLRIKNIWKVCRSDEQKAFDTKISNDKLLFHGSSVSNWVGILSRGILLPKAVIKLGVHRTDAGWLGCGIYFGDDIQTSCAYAHCGRAGTMFIGIAKVALGKVKRYRKITYRLTSPPKGFNSCHGVKGSEFDDDEFVIYKQNQQALEYLVECA
ncbi:MAG: WGR domain-containing protein [Promethearchaeota archaeon]|jgi:poly [ADP-ribose] polymerase